MSPRIFAVVLGVGLVLAGLLLGADRFEVSSDGDTGQCSSVFSGAKGDIGDAAAAQQKRQLDALRDTVAGVGPTYHGSMFADRCDAKRDQRGLFTWLLVGGGALLVAGGVLIRTKTERK